MPRYPLGASEACALFGTREVNCPVLALELDRSSATLLVRIKQKLWFNITYNNVLMEYHLTTDLKFAI